MALNTVSLTYIGLPTLQGPVAPGQIYNNNAPGPLGKTLVGYATLTGSTTSTKTYTINFIDGVQTLGERPVVVQLTSATAPATINGTANQVVYSGVGSMGQFSKGQSVVTAGFTNSGNNGTFTINAVTSSGIQVTNASGVAETNYAATATVTVGPAVQSVFVNFDGRSTGANDAGGDFTSIIPSALTNTGFTANINASITSGSTVSVSVVIYFAS